MTFDIQEILGLLPHRYPFLLIDRVVEFERAQAPGGHQECHHQRALLPGPLSRLSDHARRAGGGGDGAGRRHHHDERDSRPRKKLAVFTGIEKAKFRRPVTPGDQLRIEVDVLAFKPRVGRMEAKALWTASWPARPR